MFNKSLNQSVTFWSYCRFYRISATTKTHEIKTSKILTCEKQQYLARSLLSFKPIVGQAAIMLYVYGNQTVILQSNSNKMWFNNLYKIKPKLCASPDGIKLIDGRLTKVLEIKFPIICKAKVIIDPI